MDGPGIPKLVSLSAQNPSSHGVELEMQPAGIGIKQNLNESPFHTFDGSVSWMFFRRSGADSNH